MRPSCARFARTPLIKFVGKNFRPAHVDHTIRPHPMAGSTSLPWSGQTESGKSADIDGPIFDSLAELPKRFRNPAFSDLELDTINSGGAEFIM